MGELQQTVPPWSQSQQILIKTIRTIKMPTRCSDLRPEKHTFCSTITNEKVWCLLNAVVTFNRTKVFVEVRLKLSFIVTIHPHWSTWIQDSNVQKHLMLTIDYGEESVMLWVEELLNAQWTSLDYMALWTLKNQVIKSNVLASAKKL